jgi:predicted nuclease of predicted toxin-antitoxin system
MRFLLDANLPLSSVEVFRSRGHEAAHVRELCMGHLPDSDIAAYAQKTKSALATRDLDFADIRAYPPGQYDGLLVIRLYDEATATEINAVLEKFLRMAEWSDSLPGRLAIVEESRVRFRPAITH